MITKIYTSYGIGIVHGIIVGGAKRCEYFVFIEQTG